MPTQQLQTGLSACQFFFVSIKRIINQNACLQGVRNNEFSIENTRTTRRLPTGTCIPFFKKIFISADNKIYACERIGLQHVLGFVDDKMNLDFNRIAEVYNNFFSLIGGQCKSCYSAADCGQCLLQMPMKDNRPMCPTQMSKNTYQRFLFILLSSLEDNKELFHHVNKSIFA